MTSQDDFRYSYPSGTLTREQQTSLLKYTRITSNKAEMDTLTVSADLVKSAEGFFDLINTVTEDKAF